MNLLQRLQNWYLSNCDGDWEHQYGVRIDTLDNPGWKVEIDLVGTRLESKTFESINIERAENDWIVCKLEGIKFMGFGGPRNLDELLNTFLQWADEYSDGL